MARSLPAPPAAFADALAALPTGASSQQLRRHAAWAASRVPLSGPWARLAALAESGAPAHVLAEAHRRHSHAACAATICGLSKGIAGAAAHLTAFHAVHPDPREAAVRAVRSAWDWHALSDDPAAEAFAAEAVGAIRLVTLALN